MAEILLESEATPTADAARLLAATRPFHGRGGCERSVKIVRSGLLADRFLLSFHKRAFGPDPLPESSGWRPRCPCRRPIGAAARASSAADIIHFGYEGSQAGTTYKLYLRIRDCLSGGARRRPIARRDAPSPPCLQMGPGRTAPPGGHDTIARCPAGPGPTSNRPSHRLPGKDRLRCSDWPRPCSAVR